MITVETAQAAISVAEELDKRTIFLTPVSGTPLDQLRIQSTLAEEVSRDLEYTPNAESISNLSSLGDDVHGIQLEQFSDDIARSVQNHLSFAKNFVKPAIQQVSDKLQTEYEKLGNSLQFDLEIIQVDPPEPLVVSSFEEMVSAYSTISYIPFGGGYIPSGIEYTAPTFIELLKTANTDIDQAISVWATKKGDKFFDNVIKSLFNSGTKSIQSLIDDTDEGTDVALAVFLATNKLYDNPPDGVRMTLSSYNELVDDLRKQAAFRINQSYLIYARNTSSKLLITKYNNTQVFVNGNIYRNWIETGGNNAAIFGSILSSNPKLFLNDINENNLEYIENWESKNRLMTASIKSKSFIYKKEALRNALIDVAETNFKEYFGHLVEDGVVAGTDLPEYQMFLKLTDSFIDSVKESDLLNIWSVSTKSVCDCMFYYTSARDILEGINEAIKVNPGISLREALLLSTIEYVTNYVCNQITVSS